MLDYYYTVQINNKASLVAQMVKQLNNIVFTTNSCSIFTFKKASEIL